jgi:hypothetical protein
MSITFKILILVSQKINLNAEIFGNRFDIVVYEKRITL